MNGAESLVRTLVGGGINVCYANRARPKMHFVAHLSLSNHPQRTARSL